MSDIVQCNACAVASDANSSLGRDAGGWTPRPVRGGHSGPVVDMCWAADGACVLSVSADQTARIFTGCQGTWCEIARPEVRTIQRLSSPLSEVANLCASRTQHVPTLHAGFPQHRLQSIPLLSFAERAKSNPALPVYRRL